MNLQNIRTITRYERKFIRRNTVFQGIALLGLITIFLLQHSLQSKEQASYWFMIALPSSVPFVNTYLFTILQSVLIILAVSEWRRREKHTDTLVAIQTKNASNTEYIIGKSMGIITTLLILNAISIVSAVGIHIFDSDSPFQLFPYIFYWFTLSFPTLLFLTGLSILTTALVRNGGISMLFLFIFMLVSLYYIPTLQHGLFDFRATCLPNVFSDITGHVALSNYLTQRTCFLLLGIACIIYSIGLEKRLPNNPRVNPRIRVIATGILFASILPGLNYYNHFRTDEVTRNRYRETALKYNDYPPTHITRHELSVRQNADQLFCYSQLLITNTTKNPIPEILLYLNPTLKLTRLSLDNGKEVKFSRENQVITLSHPLLPGDSLSLRINYQGKIDERVCYPDVNTREYWNDQYQNSPLHFGKRYAYVGDDYTLLTPECLWYPATIPPVNLRTPYAVIKDFTRFSLKVITGKNKTVISQGIPEHKQDTILFNNKYNLTGLTLCIGDYEKKSIEVDSVTMELYTFKGHNHLEKLLKNLTREKLEATLRENKENMEGRIRKQYPFTKFTLTETPVSFTTFSRKWSNGSEFIQPEIVLFPEKWITSYTTFSRHFRNQVEESIQNRINMGLPYNKTREELYLDFIIRKLFQPSTIRDSRNIFVPSLGRASKTPEMINNYHDLTSLFFNHSSYFYSKDYPVMDKILYVFETQKQRQLIHFMGNNESLKANRYLSSHSLREALNDDTLHFSTLESILQLKTFEFINHINLQIPPEEIQRFINVYRNKHHFQELSFDSLCMEIADHYNIHLNDFIPLWYNAQSIPSYIVKDIKAQKIESDESELYQLSFKIYNNSETEGIISTTTETGKNKQVYRIPAGTSWEIKETREIERIPNFEINLNLSWNIPNGISYKIHEDASITQDTSRGKFAIDNQQFFPPSDEIIVDNEDNGFRIGVTSRKKKLGTLLSPKKEKTYIFQHMLFIINEAAPTEWTYCAGTQGFHGDIIKSMVFKKAGKGNAPVAWTGELPEEGRYEVFVYLVENQAPAEGHSEQYYTLTTKNGEEKITLRIEPADEGWVSIGTFDFSAGANTITLSDKTTNPDQIIYADAVKWKYIGQ
ncbi:hypothetical protein AALK14_14360 [Butyricimonas hominis]|uniref:golvesin C-terminal-like domain-containing protein n=1 Tax=Butyricimonas TaxID=574697 RepID=UPI0035165DC6